MGLICRVDCISVECLFKMVAGFKRKNHYWFDEKVNNEMQAESKNTF